MVFFLYSVLVFDSGKPGASVGGYAYAELYSLPPGGGLAADRSALAPTLVLPGLAAYEMPIRTVNEGESVYLFNADIDKPILEQNADQQRYIASLTKMMTALLVLESGKDMNAEITIPDSLTPEFQVHPGQPGPHHRPAGRGERPPPRHALRHAGAQCQRRGQRAGQRRRRGTGRLCRSDERPGQPAGL